MSGIEVAGLVLGAFPLVIEGLKFYLDGISTIKDYLKSVWNLRRLIGRIETEETVFLNAVEALLDGLFAPERARLLLLNDTETWARADVQLALKNRLGGGVFQAYIDTMKRVHEILRLVADKLDLNDDWQVEFSDVSIFRREYSKIKFTLRRKEYDNLLSEIKKNDVSQLRHLTTQSKELEPSRRLRPSVNLDLFRKCARSIHSAIYSSWACSCISNHSVNLLLNPEATDTEGYEISQEGSQFDLVFCFDDKPLTSNLNQSPSRWQCLHTHLRSLTPVIGLPPLPGDIWANSNTPPNTRRNPAKSVRFEQHVQKITTSTNRLIENLCTAMTEMQGLSQSPCFGYIVDHSQSRKHELYPTNKQPTSWTTVSLEDLLKNNKIHFPYKQRLQLSKILARDVMRFGQTPWLTELWSRNDIVFVTANGETDYQQPIISKALRKDERNRLEYGRDGVIQNVGLFTLGILLIELWFGKTIIQLCEERGLAPIFKHQKGQGHVDIDWVAMKHLLRYVEGETPTEFSDAVRVYVRCDVPCRFKDLDFGDFQEAIFTYVVHPLWTLDKSIP